MTNIYKKNLTLIHPTKFLRRQRVYKKRRFLKKLHKFKINFIKMHLHQMKHHQTLLMYKYKLNLEYKTCRDRKLTYSLA